MTPLLRRATADDLRAIADVDGRGFGYQQTDEELEHFRPMFEPERFLLACDPDSGAILGVTGSYPLDVTLPGGAVLPVPGVTWVSVDPTVRRRGILRAMFAEQHAGFVADGAVRRPAHGERGHDLRPLRLRRHHGQPRRSRSPAVARCSGPTRPIPAASATSTRRPPASSPRSCTGAGARSRPGAVSRNDAMWDGHLRDEERWRDGGSALFFLVHADGFASYRVRWSDRSATVVDLFAATDEAYAALWRVLLGLDLVDKVTGWKSLAARRPAAAAAHRPAAGADHRAWTTGCGPACSTCPPRSRRGSTRWRSTSCSTSTTTSCDRGGRVRLQGGPGGRDVHADRRARGARPAGGDARPAALRRLAGRAPTRGPGGPRARPTCYGGSTRRSRPTASRMHGTGF